MCLLALHNDLKSINLNPRERVQLKRFYDVIPDLPVVLLEERVFNIQSELATGAVAIGFQKATKQFVGELEGVRVKLDRVAEELWEIRHRLNKEPAFDIWVFWDMMPVRALEARKLR